MSVPLKQISYQSAHVTHSTTQSIGSGTPTAVAFDTEEHDNGGLHSAGANTKLTAQVAGAYDIFANIGWAANATGVRTMIVRLNGTTTIGKDEINNTTVDRDAWRAVMTSWNLAAGDYLEVVATQTSGGALNVQANPRFSMDLVSAV